jgi:hypothetical protein
MLPAIAALAISLPGATQLSAREQPSREKTVIGDWQGADSNLVAQVVSPDEGKYQAYLLKQFGAADNLIAVLQGANSGETIAFSGQGWNGVLAGGHFKIQHAAQSFDLQHVERHSPTENAKPPKGALVLLGGHGLDQWAKQKEREWDQADGPADAWKLVEGGGVEVVPDSGSIITKKQFGDFKLHVEFRTLGPVNSGVYLQARYEVNLNESYGRLEASFCGALANATSKNTQPRARAALPPFQWQTLDIEFRAPRFDAAGKKAENARATVALNGATLYEQAELSAPRGAAKRLGEASTGPIMLQEHGSPIQFRNIWLLEKPAS